MPFKANARCHCIPEQQCRLTNWLEFDADLRQQGSLTLRTSRAAGISVSVDEPLPRRMSSGTSYCCTFLTTQAPVWT
jgi:hypothetical protein